MINRTSFWEKVILLILLLMIWYTRSTMLCEIDDLPTGSSQGWSALAICFAGFICIFRHEGILYSSLAKFYLGYVVWMIIDLYYLGNKSSGGLADGFRCCWGPMSFILFYIVSKESTYMEKYCRIAFLSIFVLASYYNVINVEKILLVRNTEYALSNLVFWSLCSFPFVFLIPKRWAQLILFGVLFIIVVITGKRSVLISILAIALIWFFSQRKENTHKFRSFIITILFVSASLYVSSHYLGAFSDFLFGKMGDIVEDQGSGRLPLYRDVLNSMDSFNIFDWLFGRGMGSITLSGHTNAHNDALQMLYEYGIIGLVLYIIMFVKLFKRCRTVRSVDDNLFLGYVSCFVIFVVLGMVSNLVVFFSYFTFLCMYWGFAEGRIEKEMVK